MSVKNRTLSITNSLSMPVSFKQLSKDKLYDARNVFDNQGVTETRNGVARYNSTAVSNSPFILDESILDYDLLGSDAAQATYTTILSGSYFKTSAGVRYKIVKVGTVLFSVEASGVSTILLTGLTVTTKYRGVTLGDRHIIALEDALYSYNGTTLTQLGQAAPTTLTNIAAAGGSLTTTSQYQPAITFYASSIGFETNAISGSVVTVSGADLRVSLSDIPATAANELIDKVRIYLKDVTANGSMLFIDEITLGTTTYNIDAESSSTQTPPTTNAAPVSGGGKYLTVFGKCVAYTGNATYKNDVLISEEYLPDAYDDTATAKTLQIPGQGEVTGIATGLYSESYLDPYLVIFKKTSTTIYSELNGVKVQTTIDDHIGCISHDTIKVRKGVVCFMSENGWYFVQNGKISKDTLGEGHIDDIFSREGWAYQLNTAQYLNFFSAYYSTLKQYITFVCEGSSDSFSKAYVYEEKIGGFRIYEFKQAFTCAFEGEDDNGNQCIFIGDANGFIYTLSVKNSLHDEDYTGASQTIPTFVYQPFLVPGDEFNSCTFKILTVKALNSANSVIGKAFPEYAMASNESRTFDFTNSASGFILDQSQLDVDILRDDRIPVSRIVDINRTGEAMVIGFFQDILDANIGLLSSQLAYIKNGNRNL
jgi:hypothetical protein